MAKKRKLKSPHVLPKRIAGVKVPKNLRNAARSPLGVAIIAEATVEIGKEALTSRQLREAIVDLRAALARTAIAAAYTFQNVAHAAGDKAADLADDAQAGSDLPKPRRRRDPTLDESFAH